MSFLDLFKQLEQGAASAVGNATNWVENNVAAPVQNYIEHGQTPVPFHVNNSVPTTAPVGRLINNVGATFINPIVQTASNTVLDTISNAGRTLGGRPLEDYSQVRSPLVKLGYQAGGALNGQAAQQYHIPVSLQAALPNARGSLGYVANFIPAGKGIAGTVSRFGVAGGLQGAFDDAKTPQQRFGNIALSAGFGGVLAGLPMMSGHLPKST